jgi:hypothetical protein
MKEKEIFRVLEERRQRIRVDIGGEDVKVNGERPSSIYIMMK